MLSSWAISCTTGTCPPRRCCWPRHTTRSRADGALIVFEALIDDDRKSNAFGLLMSLNMLIETPGGFDYTGATAPAWMREAGFKQTRVEHLEGPDSMVVGLK